MSKMAGKEGRYLASFVNFTRNMGHWLGLFCYNYYKGERRNTQLDKKDQDVDKKRILLTFWGNMGENGSGFLLDSIGDDHGLQRRRKE